MTLKGETITDPIVLGRLAEARKKALVVRQANAEARKDKKLLDDIELKQNKEMVKTKLSKLTNKVEEAVVDDDDVEDKAPKAKPKKVKPFVKPPVVESESEEEAPVIKKKSKKKAPKVVYETESSSSEEEVIVRRKKKVVATPRHEPAPQQITQPEPTPPSPPKHDPIGDLYHRLYGR